MAFRCDVGKAIPMLRKGYLALQHDCRGGLLRGHTKNLYATIYHL